MELDKQLEKLITENEKSFYRLAYSYVKNQDDALDVVQEAIYKAFASIESLKNVDYIKTWFYRIIVNVSLDYIRKRKKELVNYDEYILSNDSGTEDHYSDIDLKQSLDSLPEKYKTIIILRFFEEVKLEEIAQVMDKNVNTIKTWLYKALRMLRISIDEERDVKNG